MAVDDHTESTCGQASMDKDWLDETRQGKTTEEDIAKRGAVDGDEVGDLEWTKGEISASGG